VTLKKKAADERLVVPKTHTTKFTHASRKTKKNGRHLYAHEPHILLRIFLFIVKNKNKKNSARFLTPFFPLVWILRLCNLLIFFFNTSTPPTEKCSTLIWGRVNVSKSRMKRKNPPHYDEIARWCWPNKVQSRFFKVCLHFSRSITHTNSAGYCVGAHTHTRSILFCWAI
jgi:hypothetical protein